MQVKKTGADAEAQIAHYTAEVVSLRGRRRELEKTGSKEQYEAAKRYERAAWLSLDSAVKRLKPP